MQGEMEGRILYGSKTFLKRAKALLGIEERVRVRGRPKKQGRQENRAVPFILGCLGELGSLESRGKARRVEGSIDRGEGRRCQAWS